MTPLGLDRVGSLRSVWLPLAHVLGFTIIFKDDFSLFFLSTNALYEYTKKITAYYNILTHFTDNKPVKVNTLNEALTDTN